GASLAIPAAAAAPAYTVTALTITVTGIPDESVANPGGGGGTQSCDIAADLYRPAAADTTHRVPAILTTNGFGGSKADQAGLGKAFAARGYAFLSYTGLGFPNTGCKIYLDDPAFDGKAASQLISFLGGSVAANNGYRVNFVK